MSRSTPAASYRRTAARASPGVPVIQRVVRSSSQADVVGVRAERLR